MMDDQNCIFCQIASGKIGSKKIYEDDVAVAILDINPASPGHVLVIPKTHYPLMMQTPSDVVGHLFVIAKNISNRLLRTLKVDGTNIIVANGTIAGQKAPHLMLHIIPRKESDGLGLIVPEKDIPSDSQLEDKIAGSIAKRLNISDEDVSRYYSGSRAAAAAGQLASSQQGKPKHHEPSGNSDVSHTTGHMSVDNNNNNDGNNNDANSDNDTPGGNSDRSAKDTMSDSDDKQDSSDLDKISELFR